MASSRPPQSTSTVSSVASSEPSSSIGSPSAAGPSVSSPPGAPSPRTTSSAPIPSSAASGCGGFFCLLPLLLSASSALLNSSAPILGACVFFGVLSACSSTPTPYLTATAPLGA